MKLVAVLEKALKAEEAGSDLSPMADPGIKHPSKHLQSRLHKNLGTNQRRKKHHQHWNHS